METTYYEADSPAIADVQRNEIHRLVHTIADWLAGIVSTVETGSLCHDDIGALHRELAAVERRLERLTTDLVVERLTDTILAPTAQYRST